MTDKVIAEVILRSVNGSSVLDAVEGITTETITRHKVSEEVIREASNRLEALGFKIEQTGPVGLTISGPKGRFEEVFQTTLEVRTKPTMPPGAAAGETAYHHATKRFQVPADLNALVADVVLPTPPEYFP